MNFLIEVFSVILSFSFVCPVLTYYVYDESPLAGYLAVSGIADYARKMPAHKKYFIGNGNQKNMKLVNERAVDSYFRVLKSSPKSYSRVSSKDKNNTPIKRGGSVNTEPPKRQQKKTQENANDAQNDTRKDGISHSLQPTSANPISKRNDKQLFNPSLREYFKNHNIYEMQQNSHSKSYNTLIEANAKKFVNKLNDRRPHLAQSYHQQKPVAGIKDKILHKANVNNDRNAHNMARMLNDITQKVIDRNFQKEKEYRKRHTIDRTTKNQENTHNQKVDYFNKKSKYMDGNVVGYFKKLERLNMPARIGNYDVGRGVEDPPYALFYRMNHDLEEPERLTAGGGTTVGEPTDGRFTGTGGLGTSGEDLNEQKKEAFNTKDALHNKRYTAFHDR